MDATTPVNATLTMPKLGLGTWRMSGADCTDAVMRALDLGYRHIDTAEMYGNEAEVGDALARTSVARDSIHVTTKVWWEHLAPDALRRSADQSLAKLKLDFVDLYLIHWPHPKMDLPAALEAMLRLKADGRVKNIGVSNFPVALMRRCVEEIGAPIVCNQVEYHIMLDQSKVIAYGRAHKIAVTAYCPLARGNLGDVSGIDAIARKHGVTPAQVALKWLLDQDGVAAIPKASQPANQAANLAALNLELDDADRAAIGALPKSNRLVSPAAFAPEWDQAA
jgi:2,5-diketo-D-gluconate reductase B